MLSTRTHTFNHNTQYKMRCCIESLGWIRLGMQFYLILIMSNATRTNRNPTAMAHTPKMLCWNSIRKFSVKERLCEWVSVYIRMYIFLVSRLILCRSSFVVLFILLAIRFGESCIWTCTHTYSLFQLHISLHFCWQTISLPFIFSHLLRPLDDRIKTVDIAAMFDLYI